MRIRESYAMRTTLDIPDALLIAVEASSGAPTRREAVIVALEDYLRRRRRQQVVAAAGSLSFDTEVSELRAQDRKRVSS